MRPTVGASQSAGQDDIPSSSTLEETILAYVEDREPSRDVRASEGAHEVIVSNECVKRLRRIAYDTRCVLTCDDANFLATLADALDGEKLPPTERAPLTYPKKVPT